MNDTTPQVTYISTHLWCSIPRFQAIHKGMPIGPSRTTMLLALSDAHRMGKNPTHIFDGDSHKWTTIAETTA